MRVRKDHCLVGVPFRASPNWDERPQPEDVALIVIHGISLPPGRFGGNLVDGLFTNSLPESLDPDLEELRDVRVSAHVFIDRTGRITQYVPFHRRAWHAGKSAWHGRPSCNDYAIGIELEGIDELDYADAQYRALIEVSRALLDRYPRLSADAVVGHQEIAPGRKTDPGPAFDWQRYLIALAG
ncbi:MAG: 1,6-anhydro-N-acetylmuramyl-L-alanine amidase AmpD [Pseudomonadales bacterium]|nr:1,6-anhydro-N-acetylmuramyl-L-alanine amidase AmpD [Pseudomonadales bacterium]NIX08954.1 1,6-anhydro-N-acetylmuramyl-L-alanine amidase AmpD [Pseudomonadales bacterium]